jgi:hypothetical protein
MMVKPLRQASVRMQENQEFPFGRFGSSIHLSGTTGRRMENLDTPGSCHLYRLIGTSAVNHDSLDTGTILDTAKGKIEGLRII